MTSPRRSQTRDVDPDAAERPAFVIDRRFPPTKGSWHSHKRAQLVHAAEGVIVVETKTGRWVAPPQRAIWVPKGVPHSVSSRRPFRLLTLYIDAERAPLSDEPRVVAVDRLVEELLAAAAPFGHDYPEHGPEERLLRVILDRLPTLAVAPLLHLPEPQTPEVKRISAALVETPSDARTIDDWAATLGTTTRTLSRRFTADTGMTFGRFRQQLRLLAALERLGAGESVTAVAFDVGYKDVSSFIGAFKAATGDTPARYFK